VGLFSRKEDPQKELAKALALRGKQGRATVVSMRETGNERDGIAKEIEFVLDLEVPEQGGVRVSTLQYMNRYTRHVRYRTDVVGGDIVVVEVEDLG
jgi:hypothetical protein